MVQIVYTVAMAKRSTGPGKGKVKSPKKTQKRLAIKHAMLAEKAAKKKRK